ncbi:MAG: MerR family transcriptional regulator [Melioribacteraceae bacterium]|nr:MerR family transcriptional regulator [Melioribacteraceae bacterium]
MKLSIGEFSAVTSLTIKSLRLYHEKGILIPSQIDEFTQYRYYDEANLETAKSIKILREYDFSLSEIKEILDECDSEENLLEQLQEKFKQVQEKIQKYQNISNSLANTINLEKENKMHVNENFEIEEKEVETILIAGYRMKGQYHEIGKGFGIIGKKFGRHINGKAMGLYFDGEYKENDADFEACFSIRKGTGEGDISVRELKGGKCVSLIHKGPYNTLSESYKKVFTAVNETDYKKLLPTREVYIKGPGMIFKGNPKNYLTEIQIFIEE